jgi:cyclopropane fatty-acyl-phospholipid synthase-like methyltransferase
MGRGDGGRGNGDERDLDAFYWAFEERMRGSSTTVRERLGPYEDLARALRDELEVDGATLRWVDLGCGRGEFCELLRAWGWQSEGVDRSERAEEACGARGIPFTRADVFTYLQGEHDPRPDAVSAIQLIEHLPRERWLTLFRAISSVLRPGGALLLETINGRNLRALADHFIADLTHTWPGHPETLRLLAEHTGFVDVEIRFEHPDARGAAEDVAIVARTPPD